MPLAYFAHSYHNVFRTVIWLLFLVVYSQAGMLFPWFFPGSRRSSEIIGTVREPLDRLNPLHSHLDIWEVVLYVMALAFTFEGALIHRVEKDCLQVMINRLGQCLWFLILL